MPAAELVRGPEGLILPNDFNPPMPFARPITHMISCKDASRLLSKLQDGQISWFDRMKLRLHLTACDACRRFERQLKFLRAAMQRYRS